MKIKYIIKLFFLLLPILGFSQGYTSYFTGNTTNITTNPEFGVCLMGGATENDNAMIWLLQKANGGDVVVLRSTGSNGYNNYLYTQLGVNVNSVETLVITSVAGATNPYVLNKVANAEMIWFAGGDQYNYVSYFKDNVLEDLINAHVNTKHAPIGGTSAGMAILGSRYFSAQNGSVTSAQALTNPYHPNVTLGNDDFLQVPFLHNVITDTHYDNPDRRGRHAAFMARIGYGDGILQATYGFFGIACNEYVAVCAGADGLAHVYGDYPNYQEFAYFLQPNCINYIGVQNCQPNQALTWNGLGTALNVYKVPGTMNGTNYFDLNNWSFGNNSGGTWENWAVNNGVLSIVGNMGPSCALENSTFVQQKIDVIPNPFSDYLLVDCAKNACIEMYDILGKKVLLTENYASTAINTSDLAIGLYILKVTKDGKSTMRKVVKK